MVADVKERTEGRTLRLMTSDDYPAYKTAIEHVYGAEVTVTPSGRASRRMVPEKEMPPGLTYATVEKRRRGRVVEILVHLIFGTMAALAKALRLSRASRRINVSFLERYNATDRHKNARKVRKTYTFSKDWQVHESMTYFTMYSYNFCWPVRTLEYRDDAGRVGRGRQRWRPAWPTTSGRCVNGSRCHPFNALKTRPTDRLQKISRRLRRCRDPADAAQSGWGRAQERTPRGLAHRGSVFPCRRCAVVGSRRCDNPSCQGSRSWAMGAFLKGIRP